MHTILVLPLLFKTITRDWPTQIPLGLGLGMLKNKYAILIVALSFEIAIITHLDSQSPHVIRKLRKVDGVGHTIYYDFNEDDIVTEKYF